MMDKMASTQAVAPLPCPGVMVRRGGARGAGSYQGCDSSHTVHRRYTTGLRNRRRGPCTFSLWLQALRSVLWQHVGCHHGVGGSPMGAVGRLGHRGGGGVQSEAGIRIHQ